MSRRIEGLVSQYSPRFNARSPAVLQNGVGPAIAAGSLAEMTPT
jgi:hypothetical protein